MSSPSKKKRKVTIEKMNSSKRSSSILSSVTSPNKSKRPGRTSLSPSLKSKTAAISHPSSSKIHPPLTNTSFFSSIRNYKKDGIDMVSDLSKNILNDFELKYEKKAIHSSERRSVRCDRRDDNTHDNTIDDPSSMNCINNLSMYRRCVVEDYMSITKDTSIMVLIPFKIVCPVLLQDSFWTSIDSSTYMNYQSVIQFKKKKYHCIAASIKTNPTIDCVLSGISHFDLMDGLGSNNSGCLVNFGIDDDGDETYKLITWNMVLRGGITGVQVWSKRKEFRNLASAFNNRKKTNIGLVSLLNVMYHEMYGDRLQCLYLLSSFYRTQVKQKQLEIKSQVSQKKTIENNQEVLFEGTKYNELITEIDVTFKNAIKSTYTSFCVLGEPLVSATQINILVQKFKVEMNQHHLMMKRILGIDKKERLSKNNHLVSTGYYDRLIFFNFITLSRLRNPQSCINYAMVSAAALYSKGCGDNIQRRFTYSGSSSTVKTFLKNVRPYGEDMLSSTATALYSSKMTIATLDNNQKGHPKKFQRFGSSNKFVKVTARYFREFCPYIPSGGKVEEHAIISYVQQNIPSPDGMIPFETIFLNDTTCYKTLSNAVINNSITSINDNEKIDFSGERVRSYAHMINICDEVQFGLRLFLTGYNRSNDLFKYWDNMPIVYQTPERNDLVRTMNNMKSTVIASCSAFQTQVTLGWNPSSNHATKLLIPPVSLRDEIKTDGFGMATIELLCLVGILHEEKVSDTLTRWDLDRDWEQKRMFLCIDGLSLDRHRHFQKKLSNVKLSFTNAFKQAIIFQKALSRVTEIYGPLHMAFHMLQTIFTVYGTMLKWGQIVVDWKRVTASKVCDSFDLCRQLLFLMLDELDRLAWDMYLFENKEKIELKKGRIVNEDELLFDIVDDYLQYLVEKSTTTNDERRKYMFHFIIIGRKFRQFWYAMKRGDRVIQEHIMIQWIGIFYLLKKHNYVDICLNAIETEYSKISYSELMAIRINASVRYRGGHDNKGNPFSLHVLDEVMENINGWTKRLLLGPDEQSWKIHSPNLMCAHRSNNFEIDAFTKQRLLVDMSDEPRRKDYISNSTKTTEPKKTTEKKRMYEWSVLMFNVEAPRLITEKDGHQCIKLLTTTLNNPKENMHTNHDALETCIDNIFYNEDIANDTVLNDTVPNDSTSTLPSILDDEAIEDNTNDETEEVSRGKIHPLSIVDIFEKAEMELNKVNINQVRINKKRRLHRADSFYRNIYHTILNEEDKFDMECNDIDTAQLVTKPWFRITYNILK